jgi:hypothetical protein
MTGAFYQLVAVGVGACVLLLAVVPVALVADAIAYRWWRAWIEAEATRGARPGRLEARHKGRP